MATYNVNTGINSYVTLSGSVTSVPAFVTQPVVDDQIIYPNNLTVDAQLNITGPAGTHKLWHVKQTGETVATNFVIAAGDVASGGADYTMPGTFTWVTLVSGFDDYVFDGWSPQPVAGEQLITETQYGYFDSLGNYYSNVENIHDAWFVALDGTTTHFTIDNRIDVVSSDTTPNAFSFVDVTGQPRSTLIESAPIDVLGMDAGLDSPVTVTNGEWAKSSDNGTTYSAYTTGPGFVRNGDKVKVRHTTSALGLVQTDTTLDINGVSDVFSTTTEADLTPDAITGQSRNNVAVSTVIQFTPVQISGMTAGQDADVTVSGGRYSTSADNVTYSAATSAAGVIQDGQWIRVEHDSSDASSDPRATTLIVGTGTTVQASFTSTTIAVVETVTGTSGSIVTPTSRTVVVGANTPQQLKVWPAIDLPEKLDYAWDLTNWISTDTISAVEIVLGSEIVDSAIYSNTAFMVWIDPDKSGSDATLNTAKRVTARITTTAGRVIEISSWFNFLDK